LIKVTDLVKQYGLNTAVKGISFTIEKGHIYGFLGPNGAGKSTTMNMMTGYLAPTSGKITVNGHDITENPEEVKRCIGYLPEVPPLYAEMTVKEYLTFAAELKGVSKAEQAGQIDYAVSRTGLGDVLNRLTANLSKGYRQRVGIAQAIIGSPEIIILDEPTIGLDPKQILEIRALIRDLGKNHTVILSSHILSEIQEVCDRIIIINGGRLLAMGSQEELAHGIASDTVDASFGCADTGKVSAMLMSIPEISGFTCREPANGEITVKIRVDSKADLRKKIFDACVKNDIPLLMMVTASSSLERIFLELTGSDASSQAETEVLA